MFLLSLLEVDAERLVSVLEARLASVGTVVRVVEVVRTLPSVFTRELVLVVLLGCTDPEADEREVVVVVLVVVVEVERDGLEPEDEVLVVLVVVVVEVRVG